MDFMQKKGFKLRIMHELPYRLRLRNAAFWDPDFDAAYLEAILLNIPGVKHVRFNLKTASVVIGYDGDLECRKAILNCAEFLPDETFRSSAFNDMSPDPVGAGAKGALALLTPAIPRPFCNLLSWGLGLPVLLEGVETLLNRGVKVEVLDAAAVGFSLFRQDYFTVNSIVALLGLGEYLEQVSEDKATGLLRNLLRPQVETVSVERQGHEIRVSLDEVVIGDRVICGSGEMIPVDGRVVGGDASVNQSFITGESVPVHVQPGDKALSGAVVEEGHITIEARQVGADTSMSRINRFLENSLRFKSESQKQSDELADRLVPTTLALGLALFLVTRDVRRAAAVLTVDYSCAIKLANPVAVRTAMYTAAHSGVLLKGSQALDALAQVDTVIFDKTGTLTRGILEVTDVIPVGDMTPEDLLALAAGAEEHYDHPVARAVVREAAQRNLSLPATGEVDFIVAHGVSAYVNNQRILVGSHHFLGEDEGVDCSIAETYVSNMRKQGKSLLYVARESQLEGIIALRDTLRPEADRVLADLKALGIRKLVMLTGDHRHTASAIAGKLPDLDEVHWELKPEDKAVIVKQLKSQGSRIAFAGDGVNDAPALVTAEVGICMPGGADLAREAAQVVLLEEDLSTLADARRIACQTMQTLTNCFRASVGMNTLFLLLASSGVLPPVIAAVLHNANTVGILGYAALAGMHKPKAAETLKTSTRKSALISHA